MLKHANKHDVARAVGACLLAALLAGACWADGGVVRAIEQDGPWQISAFTSPNPLVAPVVDVSLLVQDAKTLAPVEAEIEVSISPHDDPHGRITLPATAKAATNKLFRACLVELEPGRYDVVATCVAGGQTGRVRFEMEVGPAPVQLATLWPWIAWPVVPITLFGMHRFALRRKRPQSEANASRQPDPGRLQ